MIWLKPETKIDADTTVFDLHRMYCIEKRSCGSLRFGQYIMNMVYPKMCNPDLFYNTDDVFAMTYCLTHFCETDGTFKPIESDQ